MGIDLSSVPDAFKSKIAPEVRTELGFKAQTTEDGRRAFDRREEGVMHEKFQQFCNYHQLGYVHSRMDKKATIKKGWPDFSLFLNGRSMFVEFKAGDNKLSEDQEQCIESLRKAGMLVEVAYDLGSAMRAASEFFKL